MSDTITPCRVANEREDTAGMNASGIATEIGYSLLLEVILPRTASFAAGEGAPMVPLACVNAEMASEVAAGGEATFASAADMLFLWNEWEDRQSWLNPKSRERLQHITKVKNGTTGIRSRWMMTKDRKYMWVILWSSVIECRVWQAWRQRHAHRWS